MYFINCKTVAPQWISRYFYSGNFLFVQLCTLDYLFLSVRKCFNDFSTNIILNFLPTLGLTYLVFEQEICDQWIWLLSRKSRSWHSNIIVTLIFSSSNSDCLPLLAILLWADLIQNYSSFHVNIRSFESQTTLYYRRIVCVTNTSNLKS